MDPNPVKRQASFQEIMEAEYRRREARAEKITCLVWFMVIFLTYSLFLGFAGEVSQELFIDISLLVAVMAPSFAILALIIHLGYYSPVLRYFNTFLQVTLVSGAVLADTLAEGPQYALSSMPPLAYGLVAAVTAFRLEPLLGVFAGMVAGVQFLLLYLFVITPGPELIAAVPSLGLDVTLMKVVILIALGIVCGFAARRLKRDFRRSLTDALNLSSLEKTFGRFVSHDLAGRILQDQAAVLTPREREAVIVFGDIRGFTAFSSHQDPSTVAGILNRFFEIVSRVVEEEGGIVNKFLGDGYLALFGLFSDNHEPCHAAARAVLRIEEESESLLGPVGLKTGASAHYGPVITGEIGSAGRCEFTAVGSEVNLTARMEQLNSRLQTRFTASRAFIEKLPPDFCHIESTGTHPIKGLPQPVEVFSIRALPQPGGAGTKTFR